jgi:DivIVA domain-containing protein
VGGVVSPTRDYPQRVDRDAIERRDFPVGRRGYDQVAVDEHLRRVADELEALRGRTGPSSLSAGTSEQVRVILEAAEASAADLRADAARQSADHVGLVQRAAGTMLDRLHELERELEQLRASAGRLNETLAQLHGQAGELGAAAEPPEEDFAAAAPPASSLTAPPESSPADAVPDSSPTHAPAPSANGDEAGARLIALNMALSGTPREETARYLSEHFELADAGALLDDVYDRAAR